MVVLSIWISRKINLLKMNLLENKEKFISLIQQFNQKHELKWWQKNDCQKAYFRRWYIWKVIIQVSKNLNYAPEIIAEKIDQWRQNQHYILNHLNLILAEEWKKQNDSQ